MTAQVTHGGLQNAEPNGKPKRRVTSGMVFNILKAGHKAGGPQQAIQNLFTQLPWLVNGRASMIGSAALDPPNRDLDRECGYPVEPTKEQYKRMYDRVGPAHRYVNIWPDECWAVPPELYEKDTTPTTPFEKRFQEIKKKTNLWHYCRRVDRASRIYQFGVLLIGLDDGGKLENPPISLNDDGTRRANSKPANPVYLRPFDQTLVTVSKWEDNESSPRFSYPVEYEIEFGDPLSANGITADGQLPSRKLKVHWLRVLHVAEMCENNDWLAVPALRPVYNDMLDVRKVGGSASEIWWKTAFPALQWVTNPDFEVDEEAEEDIEDEVEALQNGLQRYMSAVGGEWKMLAPSVADPTSNLTQKLILICATGGFPLRVFLGTESGQLAGTSDTSNWKDRLRGRQTDHCEVRIARALADRFILLGALPAPESGDYKMSWRDLHSLGEKEQAEVALKRIQALMQYVTGKVFLILPVKMLFSLFLGMSDAQAAAIVETLGGEEKVKAALIESAKPVPKPAPQGGGRAGNAGGSAGRPAGVVEGQP